MENWKEIYIEKLAEAFLGFGKKEVKKELPINKRTDITNDTRTDSQMQADIAKKKLAKKDGNGINRGVDRTEKQDWTF